MIAAHASLIGSRSIIPTACGARRCSISSRRSSSSNASIVSASRTIYHWYFLTQPAPFPETLIGKDPDYFLEHELGSWSGNSGAFTPEALAAYHEAFRNPEVIHATCEDYRAGITCDCKFDEADRAAGRKIALPMLALWGALRRPNRGAAILEVWKNWATDIRGKGLECGHFIPEEAPDALTEELLAFFAT